MSDLPPPRPRDNDEFVAPLGKYAQTVDVPKAGRLRALPLWTKISVPAVVLLTVGGFLGRNDERRPNRLNDAPRFAGISTSGSIPLPPRAETAPISTSTSIARPATTTAPRTTVAQTIPTTVGIVDDVYYENCTAVRAAGADPILRGEPGYDTQLDRDGDGIACE